MPTRAIIGLAALILLAQAGPGRTQAVDEAAIAARLKAHVEVLASDAMNGREPGTAGYEAAAAYVAGQMKALGLKPAGRQGSYFQPVPMVAYRAADTGALTLKDPAGRATPLVFGEDYVVRGQALPGAELRIEAPLVFAGFGIVAPERGRDDYAGLDVKGKVVVVLGGAPAALPSEERAYYAFEEVKRGFARARGAAGYLVVDTPTRERVAPFANAVRQHQAWGMTWRAKDGNPGYAEPLPALGTISLAGAAKLFAGAPMSADQVMAAAEAPEGAVRGFALPRSLAAVLHTESRTFESENVVGLLPGADPKLKDQYTVLSAHLDGLGVSTPVKGDAIYNGALDNAVGVATALEVARLFQHGERPRRSLIFLMGTAEEKGLIGADYFALFPTVPKADVVADVNLDMPVLTYDFTDVVAFGAERSNLGPLVRRAAAGMNVALSPDPMPEQAAFVRSDHFRFVQQGVPSVFLITGYANGGETAFKTFLATRYHKPDDDLTQAIRYDAGARFTRLNYAVARELSDADARPAWNGGDFFGSKYAPAAP